MAVTPELLEVQSRKTVLEQNPDLVPIKVDVVTVNPEVEMAVIKPEVEDALIDQQADWVVVNPYL